MSDALVLPELALAGRVFGAALFAVAAAGKLRDPTAFVGVVANYQLVPTALAPVAAFATLGLEAGVAAALGTGVALPAAGALGAGLLAAFAGAMAVNILRGRTNIDCGCFRAAGRRPLSWTLVGRNLAAAVLLALLTLPGRPPNAVLEVLNGLAGGIGLLVIWLAADAAIAAQAAGRAFQKRFS